MRQSIVRYIYIHHVNLLCIILKYIHIDIRYCNTQLLDAMCVHISHDSSTQSSQSIVRLSAQPNLLQTHTKLKSIADAHRAQYILDAHLTIDSITDTHTTQIYCRRTQS